MGVLRAIKREWFYVTELLRLLGKLKSITPDSDYLTADLFEDSVDAHAKRPAFVDGDMQVSYAEFDAYANRVANWALSGGLKAGDTVALYMANRWEYVAIWYGLSKVGVIAALLNNQVSGKALGHGLNISGASHVIVEGELAEEYEKARPFFEAEPSPRDDSRSPFRTLPARGDRPERGETRAKGEETDEPPGRAESSPSSSITPPLFSSGGRLNLRKSHADGYLPPPRGVSVRLAFYCVYSR